MGLLFQRGVYVDLKMPVNRNRDAVSTGVFKVSLFGSGVVLAECVERDSQARFAAGVRRK